MYALIGLFELWACARIWDSSCFKVFALTVPLAFSSSSILYNSFVHRWGPLFNHRPFREAFSYRQSHCYLVYVNELVPSLEAWLFGLQRDKETGYWIEKYLWHLVICVTVLSCASYLESCPQFSAKKSLYLQVVFDFPCLLSRAPLCSSRCRGSCWGPADHSSHHVSLSPSSLCFFLQFHLPSRKCKCWATCSKVFRISRWHQHNVRPSAGPSDLRPLCFWSWPCCHIRLRIALLYSAYCLFLSYSNINSTGGWASFSVLFLCYICSRWNLSFDR